MTAIRKVRLGPTRTVVTALADGSCMLRSPHPLGPYPRQLTERLEHWAGTAPERVFLAKRAATGGWRTVTYGDALRAARRIGMALLRRPLSPERPIAILSGNDLEHALLGLAALYVGIPYAPISPAYSLLSSDHGKLRAVLDLLTPGLVFAADGQAFARAIAAAVPSDAELVVTRSPTASRQATLFETLLEVEPTASVDDAHAAVEPDHIAKFLFTSGSTGMPKGVINTHRMLSSNQQMLLETLPFMAETPPVIVDWLPWNHTFGGNHNMGLVLYNGGSLYIDDGKPTPDGTAETVRNLRDIAPTVYFNVPKGYEALIPHLRREPELRRTFFSRLSMMFYAAAGLSQHLWDALDEVAVATCGERILMITGLGSTETAPFAICANWEGGRSGAIGLPVPGQDLRLVPTGRKLEAVVRGPNVTPGYWRNPEATRAAFDAEGWYRMGDAVAFIDPAEPEKGLLFDGRLSEDFKLSTGTWVSVGPLKTRMILHFAPYIRDVVIAGHDRDQVGALIYPDIDACRALAPELAHAPPAEVLRGLAVRRHFGVLLQSLAETGSGSAGRIRRAVILDELPSIDAHEGTDKGSLNAAAVLRRQVRLVEELFSDAPPAKVITLGSGQLTLSETSPEQVAGNPT